MVAQQSYLEGEMIDSRDGKKYRTVEIDKTIWISDNLEFETINCQKPKELNQIDGIHPQGFFYSYEEAKQVCPADFRIPTQVDFANYLKYLIELK